MDKLNNKRIYYPELDGLRLMAFLLVFIHHFEPFGKAPLFSILHTNGWIGVDLFFTLSAFLFTKLLMAEYKKAKSINIKKFYIRRVFRIWPLYFLFIGLAILLQVLLKGPISEHLGIRIVGLFTFSDNIMSALYGYNPLPYVAHLWTITYEEQFYLLIPIIIPILARSSARTKIIYLILVIVLFNLLRVVLIINTAPHPAIWVLPISHFESIILGMVIGFGGFDFLLTKFRPLVIGAIGLGFFGLVCILPAIEEVSFYLIATYSFVGISTSLILFSVLNSKALQLIFANRIVVFLGKRSYGLYVYHLLGTSVAAYLMALIPGTPLHSFAILVLSISITIVTTIVSYKFIETPFLKLKQRFEVIKSRPI